MHKLIGLTGLKGSGKTTVGDILCSHGFCRERFAGILKDMLRVLGLDYDQIDGNAKEIPSQILDGKTPRFAMQTLGTEWGRDLISPNLWTNALKAKLELYYKINPYSRFVIDDVRFPNEVEMVKSLGGVVWRIDRPGLTTQTHASELQIMDLKIDSIILNDFSIASLREKVITTLRPSAS